MKCRRVLQAVIHLVGYIFERQVDRHGLFRTGMEPKRLYPTLIPPGKGKRAHKPGAHVNRGLHMAGCQLQLALDGSQDDSQIHEMVQIPQGPTGKGSYSGPD